MCGAESKLPKNFYGAERIFSFFGGLSLPQNHRININAGRNYEIQVYTVPLLFMNINRHALQTRFQYQRLIKVFPLFSLQIFSRKAVVMAVIIMLSVFPVNAFADKDTRVTEKYADQVSTLSVTYVRL